MKYRSILFVVNRPRGVVRTFLVNISCSNSMSKLFTKNSPLTVEDIINWLLVVWTGLFLQLLLYHLKVITVKSFISILGRQLYILVQEVQLATRANFQLLRRALAFIECYLLNGHPTSLLVLKSHNWFIKYSHYNIVE